MFRILDYLLDKGQAAAPELAAKFEVSVRTIDRDADALSSAGIPVYAAAGRDGGIQLLDSCVPNQSFFSNQEKRDSQSGIQSLSAIQYPDADRMLSELGAIFQVKLLASEDIAAMVRLLCATSLPPDRLQTD